MNKTLIAALALIAASGTASAATWTMGASDAAGTRVGAVSFDGVAAGVEIGNIGDDMNIHTADSLAAGSWRTLTATSGANSIDLSMTHEVYAGTSYNSDASTAFVNLATSATLDNAHIGSATNMSAVSLAPVSLLKQSFLITAGLGESNGMAVKVGFARDYSHVGNGSAGTTQTLFSSYSLYLNGTQVKADSINGAGAGSDYLSFNAHIGDQVRLDLLNSSLISVSTLSLAPGDMPAAGAYGNLNTYLTVSPVPESNTYAMMLAGLGLLGFMMRRRNF